MHLRKKTSCPVTISLISICVVVYCLDKFIIAADESLFTVTVGDSAFDGSGIWGKLLGFNGGAVFISLAYMQDAFLSGEVWRIITFQFVHLFIAHILVNMIALWIVGRKTESLIGSLRFFLLYITVGILDLVITNSLPIWDNELPVSGGASGAIFGIMGFAAAYGISNKGYIKASYTNKEKLYLAFYGIFFSYILWDKWTACAHTIGFFLGALTTFLFIHSKNNKG